MCMRSPKFLLRLVMSLILGVGCVTSWSGVTSYSSARRVVQDDPSRPSAAEAARFLQQSTWGPTSDLISHVQDVGFERFLEEQFAAPISSYPTLPLVPATFPDDCPTGTICRRDNYTLYPVQTRFYTNALYGEDQLRQRVAFALHQIIVVSGVNIGQGYPSRFTPYLQTLDRDAFGNFRQLLYDITLNPAMGNYLDMANNTKATPTNPNPNENYAREILQLFTIGLNRLNPDGSLVLGQTIPTYDQDIINAFARVFTGWTFAAAQNGNTNYIDPMRVQNANNHDNGAKTLLRGVTLPSGQTAVKDLNDALDNIFQDPNVGPFIGKQLIQHLVTSNPSPSYVERITRVFNGDDGFNVRGDLKAVLRAILLDSEARQESNHNSQSGRLMHPVLLITNLLRALNARSADGTGQSDGYLNPQSQSMGLDVFSPPSVFSYFSPSGGVPGTSLRGPEFGLLNTSTALRRANFVNTLVFQPGRINASTAYPFNPSGTSLDFSALQTLAGNPPSLVDTLNTLMMCGRMSSEMRSAVITAVQAVSSSNTLKRARTAVYLIATSSQYQVER
jgi:Protein of unknown function (DUF1800)